MCSDLIRGPGQRCIRLLKDHPRNPRLAWGKLPQSRPDQGKRRVGGTHIGTFGCHLAPLTIKPQHPLEAQQLTGQRLTSEGRIVETNRTYHTEESLAARTKGESGRSHKATDANLPGIRSSFTKNAAQSHFALLRYINRHHGTARTGQFEASLALLSTTPFDGEAGCPPR